MDFIFFSIQRKYRLLNKTAVKDCIIELYYLFGSNVPRDKGQCLCVYMYVRSVLNNRPNESSTLSRISFQILITVDQPTYFISYYRFYGFERVLKCILREFKS